jgi:D-tyrosyl-tRNA(Tyr) deacylase
MKMVIQRVKHASVTVDGSVRGEIDKGFLVLLGIGQEDDEETADRYVRKLAAMRIFDDEEGKTNLSLGQVDGGVLLISQFTLYADCRKGNRPSFTRAGAPDMAEALYEYVAAELRKRVARVETGVFGAHMDVELINDGPFTIVLEDL